MTLINSLQKRALLATVVLMLIGSSLYAKGKLTLSGRIVNSDGKKVKKAMVTLLSGGEVVDEEKTGGNGKFKFKKLEEGDYVLCAVSRKEIMLKDLNYWNVELQEAYFSPIEVNERYKNFKKL